LFYDGCCSRGTALLVSSNPNNPSTHCRREEVDMLKRSSKCASRNISFTTATPPSYVSHLSNLLVELEPVVSLGTPESRDRNVHIGGGIRKIIRKLTHITFSAASLPSLKDSVPYVPYKGSAVSQLPNPHLKLQFRPIPAPSSLPSLAYSHPHRNPIPIHSVPWLPAPRS